MERTLPAWSLRRELLFCSFDEAIAEIDRLYTQPHRRLGNWDLAMACDHLAFSFDHSMHGFDFGMPRIVQAAVGKFALWYVLRYRTAPVRPMMPSRLEPQPGKDPAECVARLKDSIRAFENFPGELARHPFFGKISREQWRKIHLFHLAHHLAFLHPDPAA
jgi:hypothetical protein